MRQTLVIQGMHGLGDNIHQRAILRQLMPGYRITLETSWPSVYHDLVADGLTLVRRPVALRTQSKNAAREAHLFAPGPFLGQTVRRMPIRYGGPQVLQSKSGTIMEVMCDATGTDFSRADFTLPVPDVWFDKLTAIPQWEALWRAKIASGKPLLVYRPLVSRPEWRGSAMRNASPVDYCVLLAAIRDEFFVVSVADLEPNREWIVGPQLHADVALHSGELTFEAMAALFSLADLIFTSSGFAAILGPAVKTPTVSIIGGYESVGCHADGSRYAPMLNIGPRVSCTCWSSGCRKVCDKTIDLDTAVPQLQNFLSQTCIRFSDKDWSEPTRSMQDIFFATEPASHSPPGVVIGGAMVRSSSDYLSYLMHQRTKARADAKGQKA
jgi:hypothetical protein